MSGSPETGGPDQRQDSSWRDIPFTAPPGIASEEPDQDQDQDPPTEDPMTDAKSTPKTDPAKPAAKDADDGKDARTPADAGKARTTADAGEMKPGERDDVADGQSVMERDDIGAADGPGKPDKVKVITEVHPGTSN